MLCWVVPFVERASPDLAARVFHREPLGACSAGYASNVRPFYFYALDLWRAFLPAAVLLPFAAFSAFRKRRRPGGEAGLFFLSFAAGPLLLLSLSLAKDSVYALPTYPALALLVAAWCEEKLAERGRWAQPGTAAMGLGAAGAASVAIVRQSTWADSPGASPRRIAALAVLSSLALLLGRRGDLRSLVATSAGMAALGWILWFTGPLAEYEVGRRSIRGPVEAALAIAGDRTVLLFNPSDGLRGAASFWRNRTAEEIEDPARFVRRLLEDPNAVAIFHLTVREQFLAPVRRIFSQVGAEPVVEATIPAGEGRVVVLWGARAPSNGPPHYVFSASK